MCHSYLCPGQLSRESGALAAGLEEAVQLKGHDGPWVQTQRPCVLREVAQCVWGVEELDLKSHKNGFSTKRFQFELIRSGLAIAKEIYI